MDKDKARLAAKDSQSAALDIIDENSLLPKVGSIVKYCVQGPYYMIKLSKKIIFCNQRFIRDKFSQEAKLQTLQK